MDFSFFIHRFFIDRQAVRQTVRQTDKPNKYWEAWAFIKNINNIATNDDHWDPFWYLCLKLDMFTPKSPGSGENRVSSDDSWLAAVYWIGCYIHYRGTKTDNWLQVGGKYTASWARIYKGFYMNPTSIFNESVSYMGIGCSPLIDKNKKSSSRKHLRSLISPFKGWPFYHSLGTK